MDAKITATVSKHLLPQQDLYIIKANPSRILRIPNVPADRAVCTHKRVH